MLPATRQRWESRLYPQPKQVLDLATPVYWAPVSETASRQANVWNNPHWWSGPGWNPAESSRLCGRQPKRPDGRKCWAGSEVLQALDGWRNAGAAECRHQRPERSSQTGTAVRGRSDTGELSLPAWKPPVTIRDVSFSTSVFVRLLKTFLFSQY